MGQLGRGTTQPFRGSKAVARGEVTRDRLRGPDFTRLAPDVYVGASAESGPVLRARGLAVWSEGEGTIAGPLAALVWGAECAWDDAELIVDHHARSLPGVRMRVAHLMPGESVARLGAAVTSPTRTLFDLATRAPLVDAVASVDALARRVGLGPASLRAVVVEHPGTRGTVQAGRVADLMDARAESLMESRTRLALVLRGVPPPVPQYDVALPDGTLARLDLAWPHRPTPDGRRLAVEYDGAHHRTVVGQNRDHRRDALLDDVGWEVIHVSSAQVLDPAGAEALAVRVLRRLG